MKISTVIIGAGQAGLSVSHYLSNLGIPHVILDANQRVGDTWRRRWDSLRLFTPAKFNGLPGMPFPAHPDSFPTKDEMADYLEAYASRFELPVRTGVRVQRLGWSGNRFVLQSTDGTVEADNVVVAMAAFQEPYVPPFARQLDVSITQIHSQAYRNPAQLQPGDVLVVGAGNSGAEIAKDLASKHRTWISGRDVGQIPFRIDGLAGRLLLVRLVLRVLFHRIITVDTPIGRKLRPKIISMGGPLIRVKSKELASLGVERVPRTAGVRDGRPLLDDGRVLDVRNVVWCTGFQPRFPWIDLPIHGEREPRHRSGLAEGQPGLYFVGLHFLHALSSVMVHGMQRDAERVARHVAARANTLAISEHGAVAA